MKLEIVIPDDPNGETVNAHCIANELRNYIYGALVNDYRFCRHGIEPGDIKVEVTDEG